MSISSLITLSTLLTLPFIYTSPNPFPPINPSSEHISSTNFGAFNNHNASTTFQQTFKNTYINNLLSKRLPPLRLQDPQSPDLSFHTTNTTNISHSFLSLTSTQQHIPTLPGPEYLLDYNYVDILTQFPSYASASRKPWSGYYWAHRYGMLSARYPLDNKNSMCVIRNNIITQWYTYRQSINTYAQPQDDYIQKSYGQNYYNQYINAYYSPAEKLDLLFGDPNFSLTNYMKSQGYQYMTDNDVPSWLGLCNGWSPASYLEPRCNRSITLTAYDNVTQITFLPDDMEAYATLFYAMASYNIKMIGNRCSDTTEQYCMLMNAGVFVIAIANQIGIRKENVIFEPKVDSEIWNYPVYSYAFQFYNALQRNNNTRTYTYTLTWDMLLSPSSITGTNDNVFVKASTSSSFSYSSYYIGVRLCLTYVAEDYPYHSEEVWEDTTGEFCYDIVLALASNFKVIDGFWDQDDIPTYMWTPQNKESIVGPYDNYVSEFNGSIEDIVKARTYAIYSARSGTVLKKVMEFFMNESNKQV